MKIAQQTDSVIPAEIRARIDQVLDSEGFQSVERVSFLSDGSVQLDGFFTLAELEIIIKILKIIKEPESTQKTLKSGWVMPISPFGSTCQCGKKIEPVVLDTGDGWFFRWQCSSGSCEPLLVEDEMLPNIWPFVEDKASWRDLQNVGFVIKTRYKQANIP